MYPHNSIKDFATMACHPSGVCVDIVGINESNHGRSYEKHTVCGSLVVEDTVVCFRVVQLAREMVNEANEQCEATAIAVHHVTGRIDCCRVGFLRRHLLKYAEEYDGVLAQVTEVFGEHSESPSDRQKHFRNKGCCRAVLIEAEYRYEEGSPPAKRKKANDK